MQKEHQRIWTVRLEGHAHPCLWLTHEGPETIDELNRYVLKCVEQGMKVIIDCISTRRQRAIHQTR